MRVCILTTCYPRWEADVSGPFVESLVQRLIGDFGCSVSVVAPHAPGALDLEHRNHLTIHRFHYTWPASIEHLCYDGGIPTSLHMRPWTALLVPGLLGGFLHKALKCIASCDVVHCHWMISGFIGLLASSIHPKPVIVTAHGSDISLAQRVWPFRTLNRHVIGRAAAITTVGSLQRRDLIHLGGNPQKIHHIPLGVTHEFLSRPPNRNKSVDILFVGRLTPEKRPELLVSALAELTRRGKDVRAQIVGDGPLRERIEQIIRRENLTGVELLGELPHEQVQLAMDRARCLVLTSSREGMPTVVTEAMARGLGVLACDVGSIRDVVTEDRTGWLMPRDATAEKVALRIEQLLSDSDRVQAVGEAARQFICENYTWHCSASQFHRLYQRAICRWQDRRST